MMSYEYDAFVLTLRVVTGRGYCEERLQRIRHGR